MLPSGSLTNQPQQDSMSEALKDTKLLVKFPWEDKGTTRTLQRSKPYIGVQTLDVLICRFFLDTGQAHRDQRYGHG